MAKITIQRQWAFIGGARAYQIYIDDKKIAKIRNGKTNSFDISPGEHTLQIKFDLKRLNQSPKITFSINENEEIKYYAKFTWLAILVVMIMLISVILVSLGLGNTSLFVDLPNWIRPLALMLPFIVFYFIFSYIQREKFIKIEKVNNIAIGLNNML